MYRWGNRPGQVKGCACRHTASKSPSRNCFSERALQPHLSHPSLCPPSGSTSWVLPKCRHPTLQQGYEELSPGQKQPAD